MADFAFYRLPEKKEYHIVRGDAITIDSNAITEGYKGIIDKNNAITEKCNGFIVAPFNIGGEHPLLLIPADNSETKNVPETEKPECFQWHEKNYKEEYHHDFECFHRYLEEDTVSKIVLSRRLDLLTENEVNAEEIFFKACRLYPHQMITLVCTAQSGMWLMATPEVLLRKAGDSWETMALAGTMKTPGPWSEKNKREHLIVSAYILKCLSRYCYYINHDAPHNASAANLYHLQTNYRFNFDESYFKITSILSDLFPTPAVCGLPKDKALDVILKDESIDRKYYSGFCGPWNVDNETQLFVSLRCMEIEGNCCHLYAGGGLLKESVEETEWNETEAKLETMKKLLE